MLKNYQWKPELILLVGIILGFCFTRNSFARTDYTEKAYTGTTKDSLPVNSDKLDRQGTAINEAQFWRRTEGSADTIGFSTNVLVSTGAWTYLPSTGAITLNRLGLNISQLPNNAGKFLINITTQVLTLPATNQGLLFPSSSNPWIIGVTTNCFVIGIDNNSNPEPLFIQEVK